MGIPSYFVNIVKYHKQIMKKLAGLPVVHNLYMDTNGLVYDAVRVIGSNKGISNDDYENAIIEMVCQKIIGYVKQIAPKNSVYIAFDGVAPVAKLNQQRERRYKSWFTTIVEQAINNTALLQQSIMDKDATAKTINNNVHKAWNTSAITPGTQFMNKLNMRMMQFIDEQNAKEPVLKYIYSGSNIAGEGEHKIFEYIRSTPDYHRDTTTLIYGLDADLIMLCLNHLQISENIYLYRDTPEFIQSIDSNLSKDESYYLDIPLFACSLEKLMRETKETGNVPDMSYVAPNVDSKLAVSTNKITPLVIAAIDDYILMTFMLGNDFMPHFPSINLRTTGMNVLLQTYAHIFKDSKSYLVKRVVSKNTNEGVKKMIDWRQMRAFIECLATNEHGRFIDEHKTRDRQSRRFGNNVSSNPVKQQKNGRYGGGGGRDDDLNERQQHQRQQEDEVDLTELTGIACDKITGMVTNNNTMSEFMSIPMRDRSIERYIDPFRENWEFRYYDSLFHIDIYDKSSANNEEMSRVREICVNYMEGLEWTMQYYSDRCIDWRWCYKYAYAPLLTDLVRYIPHTDVTMITEKPKMPVRELVQLCYVLPMASHNLLPSGIASRIKKEYSHYYCDRLEFNWAYCKYFWEAHTELPYIRISDLEHLTMRVQ
jgi:5'-3' exoribonuclease 1